MSDKPTIDEIMAAYATDAVEHARLQFGIDLDYSEDSVHAVERILGNLRAAVPTGMRRWFKRPPSPDVVSTLCNMYGGYIGDVFRRAHGGAVADSGRHSGLSSGPVITLSTTAEATFFPSAKVFKRLTEDDGDDVWCYYQALTS